MVPQEDTDSAEVTPADFWDRECQICGGKACAFAASCDKETCKFHHYTEHSIEERDPYLPYFKENKSTTKEGYKKWILDYFFSEEPTFQEALLEEATSFLEDVENPSGHRDIWKLHALIPLLKFSNLEKHEGLIAQLRSKYPEVPAFKIEIEKAISDDFNLKLETIKASEPTTIMPFSEIWQQFLQRLVIDDDSIRVLSRCFKLLWRSMHGYPIQELENFLKKNIDDHEHRKVPKLTSIYVQQLLILINTDLETSAQITESELEQYESLMTNDPNGPFPSLAYQLWRKVFDYQERDRATDPTHRTNILLERGRSIFDTYHEISTYTTFALGLYKTHGSVFENPSWVQEKLVTSPQMIPVWKELMSSTNKEFDFDVVLENLYAESFANQLQIGHLHHLHSNPDFRKESKDRLIELGCVHSILDESSLDSYSNLEELQLSGFVVDFPNLMRLTKDRASTVSKTEQYWEACEILIDWINELSVDCFIHTTPSSCQIFWEFIIKIKKETSANFLFYDFRNQVDEDLFFIDYAINNNLWIITRDKFDSHWVTFSNNNHEALKKRILVPYLGEEDRLLQLHPLGLY